MATVAWLALLTVWAVQLPLFGLWGSLRWLRVLPTFFALVDGTTADALRLASFAVGALLLALPAIAPLLVLLGFASLRQVARLLALFQAALLVYVTVLQNRGVLGVPFERVLVVQCACVVLSVVAALLAPSSRKTAAPQPSVFAWALAVVLLVLHAIPVVADIGHLAVPPFWRVISETESVRAQLPLTVAETTLQGVLGLAHLPGALALVLAFGGALPLRAAAVVCAFVQLPWIAELLMVRRVRDCCQAVRF